MHFLVKTSWTCTYAALLVFVKLQRSKEKDETGYILYRLANDLNLHVLEDIHRFPVILRHLQTIGRRKSTNFII